MSTADVAVIVVGVDGLAALAFGWDLLRSGRIRVVSDPGTSGARQQQGPTPGTVPPHPPMAPTTVLPPPPAEPTAQHPTATAAFAAALRTARASQNLTTRVLGELAGVDASTVSNAENGKTVKFETVARLAAVLGLDLGSLITGEGREEAS
jgi:hypothetical protein